MSGPHADRAESHAFYGEYVLIHARSGRLIHASEPAARVLGYGSAGELLAAPLRDVVRRFAIEDELGSPLSLSELPAMRAVRGQPAPPVMLRLRFHHNRQEHWVRVSAEPLRDARGKLQMVATVFHDMVTERRTLEHELTRHAIFSPDGSTIDPERLLLLADLREAIEAGDMFLEYQPKLAVQRVGAERQLAGVEALLRWNHIRRGTLNPDMFVPLAEYTGLMSPLTAWVLEEAIRQCRRWQYDGFSIGVAVNLSARSLHDPELVELVSSLVAQYELEPSLLTLEITESAIMRDAERAREVIGRLHAFGVRIAIDDFGTGYSSLGYLKTFPADELKIDKSFVQSMSAEQGDLFIVRSVIDLGHNLGLKVVAEGVEDVRTLTLLTVAGCDIVQGYGISRPIHPAAVAFWSGGRRGNRKANGTV